MLEFPDVDLVHGLIHVQPKPDLGFHRQELPGSIHSAGAGSEGRDHGMLAHRKPSRLAFEGGKPVSVDFVVHRLTGLRGAMLPIPWTASSLMRG